MTNPAPLADEQHAQRSASALPPSGDTDSHLRREHLLAASAHASRVLLEAPDVMGAMPEVLRVLGEAADVDRTALALVDVGPSGERWLIVKSEWTAAGIDGQMRHGNDPRMAWSARKSDCFCAQLRTGQSVYVCRDNTDVTGDGSIASAYAKSSIIVPFLVDGQYAGAIGFDACREKQNFDQAMVSALEIAASVIGAALHRERLINTVISERTRMGQEIHDGLAQAFTGILMQLGAAEEIAAGSPLAQVLNRIRDIAREGLSEARRSVLALRPSEPRPGGLEQALRQLADRSTVPGRITSTFDGSGVATGLVPEHQHELLRIAQEAVSNAVRHAQPRTVRIVLAAEADALTLSVIDDGCGMEQLPELYAQQGFGLTNMRERAQALGGEWRIDSNPGTGTQVTVRIPKKEPPHERHGR